MCQECDHGGTCSTTWWISQDSDDRCNSKYSTMPQESFFFSEHWPRIKESLWPGDFATLHPFIAHCTEANKRVVIVKNITKYLVELFQGDFLSSVSTVNKISYLDSKSETIDYPGKRRSACEFIHVLGTFQGSIEVYSKKKNLSTFIRETLPMFKEKFTFQNLNQTKLCQQKSMSTLNHDKLDCGKLSDYEQNAMNNTKSQGCEDLFSMSKIDSKCKTEDFFCHMKMFLDCDFIVSIRLFNCRSWSFLMIKYFVKHLPLLC